MQVLDSLDDLGDPARHHVLWQGHVGVSKIVHLILQRAWAVKGSQKGDGMVVVVGGVCEVVGGGGGYSDAAATSGRTHKHKRDVTDTT
jgi:hypothetical protein